MTADLVVSNDSPYIMFVPLAPLMNGAYPQGKELSPHIFTRSQLGFPFGGSNSGFIPVRQHGTLSCSGTGCQGTEPALLVQKHHLSGEDKRQLRIWAFFPPAGDPKGRPTPFPITITITDPSVPDLGTISAAVLHSSILHFVSTSKTSGVTTVHLGRVPLARTADTLTAVTVFMDPDVVDWTDGGGVAVAPPNKFAKYVKPLYPTLEVTAPHGDTVVTYGRWSKNSAFLKLPQKMSVAATVVDPYGTVTQKFDIVGGIANASLNTTYDYADSSRDPLFTGRIWFAQPRSKSNGKEHWIGTVDP